MTTWINRNIGTAVSSPKEKSGEIHPASPRTKHYDYLSPTMFKLFSTTGMDVTGLEISETAYKIALQFDTRTKFYMGSVLDMSFDQTKYDAIYCFNVLHLFRQAERELFLQQCLGRLKPYGFAYFTVFSDDEDTLGQGNRIEPNTFESKPGRPVHYFTDEDLRGHFRDWQILETGTVRDPENHGGQAHTHSLRYIFCRGK